MRLSHKMLPFLALGLLLLVGCQTPADISQAPSAPQSVTEKAVVMPKAEDLFAQWNAALGTKDPQKVAALYSEKSLSFLPTLSDKHVKQKADVVAYFESFLKKEPSVVVTDSVVDMLDDSHIAYTGLYTVNTNGGAVPARFSFIWTKEGTEWKISHHHSSVLPAGH